MGALAILNGVAYTYVVQIIYKSISVILSYSSVDDAATVQYVTKETRTWDRWHY
jgi:hypothetical protein